MKNPSHTEDEFVHFLESYKRLIVKVAGIYCSDTEERKDLVQDIVLQLWKSFPNYDPKYARSTWTYRIALNVSISHLRKAKTREKTREGFTAEDQLVCLDVEYRDERLEHLYRLIGQLQPLEKALIMLQLEGCQNKEIADIMGMSASNVSTKLQRIRKKLKSLFETIKQ